VTHGEVTALRRGEGDKATYVVTVDGREEATRAVLIATGCVQKPLGIPGEEQYTGRGVHSCATCDGPLYKGKKILVVGGGNSAFQESLFLAQYAESVRIVTRGAVRASQVLVDRVRAAGIEVLENTTPIEVVGDGERVTALAVRGESDEEQRIDTDAVFVLIGVTPASQFAADSGVTTDLAGYIKTDENYQTNLQNVYAAGDVRAGAVKQIVVAAGEGASAAQYIKERLLAE
jgi:thioredoxin reductase (NADPH)